MKYESELIKEIVDSRGHGKSSIHYESECAETWIEEAKGAYPKLCDYEAEWLYYISILDDTGGSEKPEPDPKPDPEPNPKPDPEPEPEEPEPPIGEFPYETLIDVTEATVDNVVPYAYKTAILKGAMLHNLISNPSDEKIVGLSSQTQAKYNYINKIDLSKKYTLQFTISNFSGSTIGFNYSLNSGMIGEEIAISGDGTYKILSKPTNLTGTQLWLFWSKKGWTATNTATISNVVLIEGDYTNVDIPYFEGMQSVKKPVLTTTNEDGSETNILTVNEDVTLRSNGSVCDELDLLTGKLTQRIGENGEVLTQEVVKTVKLTVVNQDGETMSKIKPIEGTMHLSTSSDTIPPLFSGEIPVEAITQNLASFIEGE